FLKNGNLLEAKGYQNYYEANIRQKTKDQHSYQRFWQPIQAHLKKLYPQVKKIYLSLDGVYHLINLETLWNPKSGKYLGDELAIEIVSNTKDLLYREKTQNGLDTTSQVYLFGFPQYDQFNPQPNSKGMTRGSTQKPRELPKIFTGGQIKPLPGTRKEINNIQTLLTGKLTSTLYQGKTATEENIKALKNPGVLHLATHGYFLKSNHLDALKKMHRLQIAGTELKHYLENPLLRSGLVFTGAQASFKGEKQPNDVQENGILTAQEVINLDLDSTQLVVLSACETGRGKIQNGEGVYGLQRAFLSAGAKNVLMSLWAVDDQATQYFMQYFYTALLQRQSIHKAYRIAQKRLRQDYPSPYYWGAFVLVRR
ncbi:MAG TPA: hypothetical protein DCS93_35660, partial [Microscillaceae bacterium]|nr:hypothetical protein [Microscillaceae bacterium]